MQPKLNRKAHPNNVFGGANPFLFVVDKRERLSERILSSTMFSFSEDGLILEDSRQSPVQTVGP
jgi:hypothetical protein